MRRRTWAQWRMVNSLLLATILRTCLVVISYGCKVPAGIFVPSMAVGATFGRMVGILVKALYRSVFPFDSEERVGTDVGLPS
jgi:chloride channel 3/4/5